MITSLIGPEITDVLLGKKSDRLLGVLTILNSDKELNTRMQ